MNRAERRRQAKQHRPPAALHQSTPPPHKFIRRVKSELQQATSPEDVHHVIQGLIAQGLPPAAGEELHVYAAEFHDATTFLQAKEKDSVVARIVDNAHHWADLTIEQSTQKDQRACRAGCAFCCYLPAVLVTARRSCSPRQLATGPLYRGRAESSQKPNSPTLANPNSANNSPGCLPTPTRQSLYGL